MKPRVRCENYGDILHAATVIGVQNPQLYATQKGWVLEGHGSILSFRTEVKGWDRPIVWYATEIMGIGTSKDNQEIYRSPIDPYKFDQLWQTKHNLYLKHIAFLRGLRMLNRKEVSLTATAF